MPDKARTILGFDYGTKRIGIAIAQEVTSTVSPLVTVNAVKQKPDWTAIEKLITEWQPDLLVVGLPLHMDGSEQETTQLAKKFANQLNGRFNLPVELVDERLTSEEAEMYLEDTRQKGKKKKSGSSALFQDKAQIDMIAAQLILQSWLSQKTG